MGNRSIARNEIEKMILFKGDGAKDSVTIEDIQAISADGNNVSIDDIISDICLGKIVHGDGQYQKAVLGKINPAVILRALQRHITRLLEAQSLVSGGESADGAMKSLRPRKKR